MIFIKNTLNILKLIGIFILIEIFISFTMGFFNLLGMNTSLSKILILLINLIIFVFSGFTRGKTTTKKGIIEGLITGLILIMILFILTLLIFHTSLSIATLFYYLALIFSSSVGATIGKNTKKDSTT